MEKVILRNKKTVGRGVSNVLNEWFNLASAYDLDISNDKAVDSFIKSKRNVILVNVYKENVNNLDQLDIKYNDILVNQKDNDDFFMAYRLNSKYCLTIDSHITLYKLEEDYLRNDTWMYYYAEKYCGDTWWFSEEEILDDIQNLGYLDFLMKYKEF